MEPFAEYLTVETVAEILAVSKDTVTRQFEKLAGVIDLGVGERMHKRRRRILRIPRTTLEAYIAARQVKKN